MAKPPSDDPRSVNVSLKLTSSESARLEKERGSEPTSAYIRRKLFGGRKPR